MILTCLIWGTEIHIYRKSIREREGEEIHAKCDTPSEEERSLCTGENAKIGPKRAKG